jgi:pentatricopeptide repeat protein
VPNCASFSVVISTFGILVRVVKVENMFENMVKASVEPNVLFMVP